MASRTAGIRGGLAVLVALSLGVGLVANASAQTPAASQVALSLPQGPLGEQIAWVIDSLNAKMFDAAGVAAHVAPELLEQAPADQLVVTLLQIAGIGPFTLEPDSLVSTRDLPPTNARFTLAGQGGIRLAVTITVDRASGLITGLLFQPAEPRPQVTPVGTLQEPVPDRDITFVSGGDTVYGSYMSPASATTPGAAALIISGSGPTDRNGNSGPLTTMNTNLNLATTLAANGIPSLRYDKLGSGATGLGTHATDPAVGFDIFVQEAEDALAFLASQPNVDPSRLILVGHSEGALFALVLAQAMTEAGTPPAALILASPLSIRYLDLLVEQVTAQYDAAATAGQLSRTAADAGVAELSAIVESLRTTGELPGTIEDPALAQLFSPSSIRFLIEADAVDPGAVAATLPANLPVLVLHGGKDEQVSSAQVEHVMEGFRDGGNDGVTLVELPDANHLLKVIEGTPNAVLDYANASLPFAPEAIGAITAFLEQHDLSRST